MMGLPRSGEGVPVGPDLASGAVVPGVVSPQPEVSFQDKAHPGDKDRMLAAAEARKAAQAASPATVEATAQTVAAPTSETSSSAATTSSKAESLALDIDETDMLLALKDRFGTLSKDQQKIVSELDKKALNFTERDTDGRLRKDGILAIALAKFRKMMYVPKLLNIWANPKGSLAQGWRSVNETITRNQWFKDIKAAYEDITSKPTVNSTKVTEKKPEAKASNSPVPSMQPVAAGS